VAPGAPPSPFERPRGFPRRIDSRNVSYGRSSRGVQLSFRVLPLACRPRSFPVSSLARPDPARNAGSASRDCLLPRTLYAGCPCRRDDAETPSRKARDAAPSPVPSSGFLPLSTDLAASRHVRAPGRSPPPAVTPPTLRGLVSCRSRPWNYPSELSPSGEPCPLSRAFASLRVRVSAAAGATCPRVRGRFPRRADPLPRLTREGSPDAGAGTTVPCFH
jgi:hypothetical protein